MLSDLPVELLVEALAVLRVPDDFEVFAASVLTMMISCNLKIAKHSEFKV